MPKTKFTAAAHLIHSRLEMIRNDIIIKTGPLMWQSKPNELSLHVDNRYLIRKVSRSIQRDFGIVPTLKDEYAGFELFILSMNGAKRDENARYDVLRESKVVESGLSYAGALKLANSIAITGVDDVEIRRHAST